MSGRAPALPRSVASFPCHITPEIVAAAPELAVLALLDETLRVTRDALLAAQPGLARLDQPIVWYRECVLRILHDAPERDDDLSF